MSADSSDTADLRSLVESQASTITALQAELATLRAAVPAQTSTECATSSTEGVSRQKTPSEKKYLGVTSYFPWNEERLLKLLKAVTEVVSTMMTSGIPDNEWFDAVLGRYIWFSGLDCQPKLTVLEVEYALGKIYHDQHRVHSPSICTVAINDYLKDHPEVRQFFKKHLGSPPYHGPN